MATTTKTFTFDASLESWTGVPASGDITMARETGDGSPGTGCLSSRIDGKNKNPGDSYWEWVGTFEDLGVPPGSTVQSIGYGTNNDYNWRCSEYNEGSAGNSWAGPFDIYDNVGPTIIDTFSAAQSGISGTTSWATVDGSAVALSDLASSTTIRLRLHNTLRTGNSNGAYVTILQDQVVLEISYTPGTSPIAGASDGAASVTGALTGKGSLAGASDGAGAVTGALKGTGALAGASDGAASVIGQLTGKGSLAGASDGAASVTGNLTEYSSGSISGASNGAAVVTGSLTGKGALIGASDGAASTSGTLGGIADLVGAADGASIVTGAITGWGEMSGSIDGVAAVSAAINGKGAISGAINGSSSVAGVLTEYVQTITDSTIYGFVLQDTIKASMKR